MGTGGPLGPGGPLSGLVPPPPLSAGGSLVGSAGPLGTSGVPTTGYGPSSCAVSSQSPTMLTTTSGAMGPAVASYPPPPNSQTHV